MVRKKRLYWTLQLGGWTMYALVQIIASIFVSEDKTISTRLIFFLSYEAIFCLLITHAFRYLIIQWRWLLTGMSKLIPRILLSVFLMGLAFHFIRILIMMPLGMYNQREAFELTNIVAYTGIYGLIFFLWSVLYFTYHYFERYNRSLKMEASITQIELSSLKAQLNPHFIFNALNSIRALVDENPAKSKQAINQLSGILRSSLATDKRQLTKFGDELKTVKDYLGLESIRFEERLHTEFDISPDSYDFLVPPLMLQTLVENGIKHGISKLKEGGTVQLATYVSDKNMVIRIRNSGQLVQAQRKGRRGLGIQNTVQRLKLLFGDEAKFKIFNENDKFVLTEITIPKNTKNESIDN